MSSKNSNNSSPRAKKTTKQNALVNNGLILTKKLGNITAYTLPSNGLTVLYAQVPGSITVTTTIVYNVGSCHEATNETGLAHMLEHMLFKPTSGKGVKWKDLENKGAHLNATTWLDRTLYYFTLPKQYLGDMLEVEADRMVNTLLTDAEFLPERANVLSEYEMYNSRPEMVLEWRMVAAAFENHGYHHDTIGFRGDIEAYTTEALTSFYRRHYCPNNATLIVAGDYALTELNDLVVKKFAHIKPGNIHALRPRIEAPQEGTRRVVLTRETPLRVLNLAWKAPAFTHPDWTPLMVALNYLTDGETSPLYKALVDTHLANDVTASLYPTHDPYLAFLTVRAANGVAYTDIETAIMKIIAKVQKQGVSEKALAPLREALLADEAQSRDGTRAVALNLAEYVATGDWKRYAHALSHIESVTSEDVLRVLRTYLVSERLTIGTLDPA